jgi:hypothetical protein
MLSVPLAAPHGPVAKQLWSVTVAGYRLVKWGRDGEIETLYLKDPKGRVVTMLRDFRVTPLFGEKVAARRLVPGGPPTIVLTTWTGGAHGSNAYFVWSLGKRPRCLLAYNKNNAADAHDFEFADLDGDRIPEIRSWYDGFAYTVGGSYWPDLPVVLRLERGRYVDRTARYSRLLRRAEHNAWAALIASDRKAPLAAWSGPLSAGVNLLALADLQGTRERTWRRLRTLLPRDTLGWLKEKEPIILAVERGRRHRHAYPAAYRRKIWGSESFPSIHRTDGL